MQKSTNNMAQVAKTQKPKKKYIIPKSDRKKLAIAYFQLYRAMFLKGLLSRMTIGAASYNAFQFINAKLSTMDKSNPVTKFLIRINKHRSKRIAKRIMTSSNRNATVLFAPDNRKKIEFQIPQWMNKTLATFNTLSTKYKPMAKRVTKPVQQSTDLPTVAHYKKQLSGVTSIVGILIHNKQNNGK